MKKVWVSPLLVKINIQGATLGGTSTKNAENKVGGTNKNKYPIS